MMNVGVCLNEESDTRKSIAQVTENYCNLASIIALRYTLSVIVTPKNMCLQS